MESHRTTTDDDNVASASIVEAWRSSVSKDAGPVKEASSSNLNHPPDRNSQRAPSDDVPDYEESSARIHELMSSFYRHGSTKTSQSTGDKFSFSRLEGWTRSRSFEHSQNDAIEYADEQSTEPRASPPTPTSPASTESSFADDLSSICTKQRRSIPAFLLPRPAGSPVWFNQNDDSYRDRAQ